MTTPQQPQNPRVVYLDGVTIAIQEVWYAGRILNTHVWVAEHPQFVRWLPGAHVKYDNSDGQAAHWIVVGWDMDGTPA